MTRPLQHLTCRLVVGLFSLGLASMAPAATGADANDQMRVVGLFKDTAIVDIGEQTRTPRVGQQAGGNIRLVSANAQQAVFEIDGRRITRALSDNSIIQLAPSKATVEARIWANDGMYKKPGSINGQVVSFIMDTGASLISMSRSDAQRLGIDYRQGHKRPMETANGEATAHIVTLDKVTVGEIEVNNVKAAVLEKIPQGKILLGMSFLRNVELEHNGRVMLLRQQTE